MSIIKVNWKQAKQAILDSVNTYPKGNLDIPALTIWGASASQLAINTNLPVEIAKDAAERLLRDGKVRKGYAYNQHGPRFEIYCPTEDIGNE